MILRHKYLYPALFAIVQIVVGLSPCDISNGRNAIILSITESNGEDSSQKTSPEVLPLEGSVPGDIQLSLSPSGSEFFKLDGNSLVLTGPLDRDGDDLSTIRFEVYCSISASSQSRNIPVVVRVLDINDNEPIFVGAPYEITLPEDKAVGSPIFRGIRATDADAGLNGQVEYAVFSPSGVEDEASQIFQITFPHQGVVFLNKPLDYEKQNVHYINVLATDYSNDIPTRLNTTTTLTVHVIDVDDQDPVFDTASVEAQKCPLENPDCGGVFDYWSSISEGEVSGVLDIYPSRIHAKDLDSIRAPISYSFVSGTPSSYQNYFEIDARTAVISQTRAVDQKKIEKFEIIIQVEERTPRRGRATTRLLVNIEAVDTSPPQLIASSTSGIVKEASPVNTPVMRDDGSNEPIFLAVQDADHNPKSTTSYIFELTTSDFKVNPQGILVVNNPTLDRDPPNPNMYTFQAYVREEHGSSSASPPVTITVKLSDINDNEPRLSIYPTATISAGEGRRQVMKVNAIDLDEGQNSIVTYSIIGGENRLFTIDANSGQVWTNGVLEAGQNFVLDLRATDADGLYSEGLLEISVSRGPNTSGPQFLERIYTAAVPEDAPFGTSIMAVRAIDPEGDVPYYSIKSEQHGAGKVFNIDTLLGTVTVVAPLDREKVEVYQFVIEATDRDGKSSSVEAKVVVTDVNDQSPQWRNDPYSFRVDEGLLGQLVGVVLAEDGDSGNAGRVVYSLELPVHSEFQIDAKTGQIHTNMALDYEKQMVHYLSVVASDLDQDAHTSTATVTVLVNDLSDEYPVFDMLNYTLEIPEDTEIGTVLTTINALDPDTVPEITYTLIEGDSNKFRIAEFPGRITLVGDLDYENQTEYSLVIGTKQNPNFGNRSSTKVIIYVTDVNDHSPVLSPLSTVTFPKSASVGGLLLNVSAQDDDGSPPNNQVRFALSAYDEAGDPMSNFRIDPIKGEIHLLKSLENINLTEVMITVTASDGGNPSLKSFESFQVILLPSLDELTSSVVSSGLNSHEIAVAIMPRFSKRKLKVMIQENLPSGNVVAKIQLVNLTTSLACSILEGNYDDTFTCEISLDGSSKVRLDKPLDYETERGYNLTLGLHPLGVEIRGLNDPALLSSVFVEVFVQNVNDNSPKFVLDGLNVLPKDDMMKTVVTFVLQSTPIDTRVMDFKAIDFDDGDLGHITYHLVPASNRGNYFHIESKSGRLTTQRKLSDVPVALQPFNLTLVATDSPGFNETIHQTALDVIIPVIEERHRMVLLLDAPRDEINQRELDIALTLSESTGKSAYIEMLRHTPHQVQKLTKEASGPITAAWFHLLDPHSYKPVDLRTLNNSATLSSLRYSLGNIKPLGLVSPQEFAPKPIIQSTNTPAVLHGTEATDGAKISKVVAFGALEYALLILAAFIIIFVIGAIITVCILWGRFSKKWTKADQLVMLIPPIIERPGSVLDAVAKEYEVQVLHMSVPLDDDSVQEFMHEPDSPRLYSLDNVSYISKSQTNINLDSISSDGGRPPSSNGLPTPNMEKNQDDDENFTPWSSNGTTLRPYDAYGGEIHAEIDPEFSASSTNANVMFGRSFGEPSPVETTTEL